MHPLSSFENMKNQSMEDDENKSMEDDDLQTTFKIRKLTIQGHFGNVEIENDLIPKTYIDRTLLQIHADSKEKAIESDGLALSLLVVDLAAIGCYYCRV